MTKKNNQIGMDDVYIEIHRLGEVIAVVPSKLIVRDLLDRFREAHTEMDEIKKLVVDNPVLSNEFKKQLISDLFRIQSKIKFWNEYGKE